MNVYRTSEVARIIGIHPNTVRLYEELELIPKPERRENGYRVFTDFHIEQFCLARTALKVEVLQNGLRKMAIDIIKTAATGNLEKAEKITRGYLQQIKQEQKNAEEAIEIVKQLLSGDEREINELFLTRKQTADYLQITMDTLRNGNSNRRKLNSSMRLYLQRREKTDTPHGVSVSFMTQFRGGCRIFASQARI